MDLHNLAESDLAITLEGDGQAVTVTDPSGSSASLTGIMTDIGQVLDPDTGVPVSGRGVSLSLRLSSLVSAGLSLPVGVHDTSSNPWVVEYTTVSGGALSARVVSSMPARALGMATLILEVLA